MFGDYDASIFADLSEYVKVFSEWNISEESFQDIISIIDALKCYYTLEKDSTIYAETCCVIVNLLTEDMLTVSI